MPALVLSCTRKVGGWPQVALVASVGGAAYEADGIQPALPVIARAIGVLSGRVTAEAAPACRRAGGGAAGQPAWPRKRSAPATSANTRS